MCANVSMACVQCLCASAQLCILTAAPQQTQIRNESGLANKECVCVWQASLPAGVCAQAPRARPIAQTSVNHLERADSSAEKCQSQSPLVSILALIGQTQTRDLPGNKSTGSACTRCRFVSIDWRRAAARTSRVLAPLASSRVQPLTCTCTSPKLITSSSNSTCHCNRTARI